MKLQPTKTIQKIAELITGGISMWVEAGQLIAKEIDESDEFLDLICSAVPGFTPELVMRFYALGKKQIHPELLIAEGPGPKALLKLPYAIQEKYLSSSVDVLIRNGKDWDTLKVNIRNLTPDQARQVFSKDSVRSVQSQRAFIESANVKKFNPSADVESYKIIGKRVTIRRDVTLTAKDLANILAEMES